jgi:hypothetical protein
MAIAKVVSEVESQDADWIIIEDDGGEKHRYVRSGLATECGGIHAVMTFTRRVVLTRKQDGSVLLRQDGPGLPSIIRVNHLSMSPHSSLPVSSAWESVQEYHKAG